MRKYFFYSVVLLVLNSACGGSKKDTDPCVGVPAITAVSNPASGSVIAAAPGPNFDLSVNITSSLGAGASIEVIAKPESGGNAFYTEKKDAAIFNNFSITNTPQNIPAIVEITVTSKTCASIEWSSTYRYSRK